MLSMRLGPEYGDRIMAGEYSSDLVAAPLIRISLLGVELRWNIDDCAMGVRGIYLGSIFSRSVPFKQIKYEVSGDLGD